MPCGLIGDLPQVPVEQNITSEWAIDSNWSEQHAVLKAPDGESSICLLTRFRNHGHLKPVTTGSAEGILAKAAKLKRPSSTLGDVADEVGMRTPKAAKRTLPTGSPPEGFTAEKEAMPRPLPPSGSGSICG